jgi:hypothetical protein
MVQVTGGKGGTGKAEDAKLPDAGISPKQSQESGGRKGGCTGDQSESDERRGGVGALRRRQDRWLRCRLEELILLWSATGGAESRNVAPHRQAARAWPLAEVTRPARSNAA